jgi:ureidoglycolate lyase
MSGVVFLRPEPLTAEAMAPFGAVVSPPPAIGERNFYTPWLGSGRRQATPRLHINHVRQAGLPLIIGQFERHPHSAQIFIPLDVARYLVVVAPDAADGSPDLDRARAFIAPGTLGIVYGRGVWHAGAAVLDRPGHFAVLMWRDDGPDDDQFTALPRPVELSL